MESLTIELRPQLRSGYVYALLDPGTQINGVKIIKNDDSMRAKIENKELTLNLSPIGIDSGVRSLEFLSPWVVFRIQLESALPSKDPEGLKKPELLSASINLPPVQQNLNLTCACESSLTKKEIAFERVLALPSEECEPGEWFCCSHSDVDYKSILCPRTYDCFYGSHFYVLNPDILRPELATSDEEVVCSKCRSVLGMVKGDGSFKLWSHNVRFALSGCLLAPSTRQERSPLGDFKLALKEFFKNGNLFQGVRFCAAEKGKNMSLFLKIMDRNLCVLTQNSAENPEKMNLKEQNVIKVLYKHSEGGLEDSKESSNPSTYQISILSILAAVDHLTASSLKLPPIYRSTDSYFIGYLF